MPLWDAQLLTVAVLEMTMASWHMHSTCTPGYVLRIGRLFRSHMCALAPHRGRGRRPLCSCAAVQPLQLDGCRDEFPRPIGKWRPVLPEFSSVFRCVASGVDDDNALSASRVRDAIGQSRCSDGRRAASGPCLRNRNLSPGLPGALFGPAS